MRKRIYYILLLFFLLSPKVYLQTSFKRLGQADGFSDNSLRSIIQDSKGFLWFGTFNGLNRYDGYNVKVFRSEEDNPHSISYNRITDIYEDSLNYLWIITHDKGLHRYNPENQKFINVSNLFNEKKISNFQSFNFYPSSKNTVWAISRNSGIMRIKQQAQTERVKINILNDSTYLESNDVRFAKKSVNGKMWFGTLNGLVCMPNDSVEFAPENISTNYLESEFLFVFENNNKLYFTSNNKGVIVYDPFVDSLYQWEALNIDFPVRGLGFGPNNDLLITTQGQGLIYIDSLSVIHNFLKGNSNLTDNEYFRIYCDRYGKYWFEGHERGVTFFDPDGYKIQHYGLTPEKRESPGEADDPTFFEDSNGDFWIGLKSGGICKLNRENMQFEQFMHDNSNPNSISSNLFRVFYEDNAKNLWIGTYQGGINKLDLSVLPFKHTKPSESAVLQSYNEVRSWLVDDMDRIWIGAKGGGVFCYDRTHKKIFTIPDNIINKSGYPQKNIYELKNDRNGNLLVGTKGQGLFIIKNILNEKKLKGKYYQVENYQIDFITPQPNNINSNNIYSIYEDHLGQIWIGTHDGGLNLIEDPTAEMKFKNYSHDINDSNTIGNNSIRFIMQDSKHNIWIATINGLNLLRKQYLTSEKKQFVRFRGTEGEKGLLTISDFICVFEDSEGRIWGGTYGGGLKHLIYDTTTFKYSYESFRMENGLPSDIVFGIEEDSNGNLWLATDNGLCKFNYKIKSVENYYKEEGIGDNLFSEGTSSRSHGNGEIVFGQKTGWLSFNPDNIKKDSVSFNILITKLSIWNKEILPGGEGSLLEKSIEHTKRIVLDHNQNFLSFQFAMLDFSNPKNCQYKYRLEGFDSDWIYSGNQRSATYTNLDPGTYRFMVNAANHDGFWSKSIAELEIIIEPPFYQTWWFIIFVALFVVITTLSFYFYKMRNLRHQKEVLEEKVNRRTSEIKNKNDELLKQTEKLNHANNILEERQLFIEEQAEELRAQKEKLEFINESLNETNTRLEERQQRIEEQTEELTVQAEDLSLKNEELKKLNATKDKLFSIISHDLKNPFNSILGFCQIIINKYDNIDKKKHKHLIEIIYSSAKNIYQLLENLLQWSRTQSGSLKFNPEKLNVKDIVDENLQLVANMLDKKNIEVFQNISDSTFVFADLNMFSTVIRNLLTNAIKFTENGNIKISALAHEETVTIEISDTGVGIPEDKISKLFLVEKSKSTEGTNGEQGTGLGLLICKEFIQRNSGEIYAKSEEGKGTLFGIVLPIGK